MTLCHLILEARLTRPWRSLAVPSADVTSWNRQCLSHRQFTLNFTHSHCFVTVKYRQYGLRWFHLLQKCPRGVECVIYCKYSSKINKEICPVFRQSVQSSPVTGTVHLKSLIFRLQTSPDWLDDWCQWHNDGVCLWLRPVRAQHYRV